MTVQQLTWAARRLAFYAYTLCCVLTVFGGWLTMPLATWLFFGDWRCWKYLRPFIGLWWTGYAVIPRLICWENAGFMFSVPLIAPPLMAPNRDIVELNRSWMHGSSCGTCFRCCDKFGCPILDVHTSLCMGYNSFYWRYFNCGRFPYTQQAIDYYDCPKWVMRDPLSSNRQSD